MTKKNVYKFAFHVLQYHTIFTHFFIKKNDIFLIIRSLHTDRRPFIL